MEEPKVEVRVTRAVYYAGKDTVVGKKMKMPAAHARYLESAKAVVIIDSKKNTDEPKG